ncbi:MAG: zinc ABC transporter substrate-binding protein [Pseudomonadota bacterium]
MFSRRLLLGSATALAALSLSAPNLTQADEPTRVVATFSILGDMVQRIGGEHIALTTLVGPNGDAHVYQPSPADARAVSEAQVLIENGLEFEGWLGRLVEASDFSGVRVMATDGVEPIAFDDGHDDHGEDKHDDHDDHGHDDHAEDKHDDHGHEGGHGHGAHAFEWAGLFELEAGTYTWSFAKVGGDYADPAMKMVILSADDIEAVEETAEDLLEADASETKTHGDALAAKEAAYALTFDAAKEVTTFTVTIADAGKFAFFTEHMPFEFEANEHFFKDASGADVEPIAQEPDVDHGDHGHGGHHGHDHGAFDPHAWQSLENAVIYVDNVTEALAKADPANAASFYENRAAYVAEIEALQADVVAMVAEIPENKRTVVTSHDAFGYFADSYGLTFAAPQGLSTESEASAKDVAELIKQIRKESISAVFVETITDNRLLEQIANETGAAIGGTLYSDALSDADGPAPTYLDMMRHNATTISTALGS